MSIGDLAPQIDCIAGGKVVDEKMFRAVGSDVQLEELIKYLKTVVLSAPSDLVDKREFALDLLLKLVGRK